MRHIDNSRDNSHWNYSDILHGLRQSQVTVATSDTVNESLPINFFTTESSIEQTVSLRNSVTMTTILKGNLVSALNVDEGEDYGGVEHHNIMVAILMAIFMCISLSIAVSIFVFCRKKNSVFMLQKCEQDSDLEMNDINTEVNTSESDTDTFDSEYEVIECSSPQNAKRRRLQKSESSPYEFLSCYENKNIKLALSNSFPDLTKYAAEIQKPIKIKDTKDSKKATRKKSKERTRHKNMTKGQESAQEQSAVPLLNPKDQTGSKKCSKGIQTGRKITCHSLSMPTILEKATINEKVTNDILPVYSNTNNNPVTFSGTSDHRTTLNHDSDINAFNDNQKMSNIQTNSEHFYCIVEINEPKLTDNSGNCRLFDA